eukprot:4689774-Alexandrium_andersonii.AAC.1
MSASLVGSEMCIRDRPPPPAHCLARPPRPPATDLGNHLEANGGGGRARACLLYTSDAADDM